MTKSLRFGTALSALVMAGALAGCATGQKQSLQGSNASASKIGLATRAQAALAAGDFATAVSLAEQAVERSPGQAAFRAVLGNAYFGAGRFASAESAYRDSLSLTPGQPNLVLKLALAEIAQGKNASALSDLENAREYLEAADYGLAVALAGQPADAVAVLGQAARLPGADARVRQNLALAHGLSGDWTMARTIAAQDISPDQVDSRIQQWMTMATPTRASDQVAAITGITPSADPGQPVRLALTKAQPEVRLAEVSPPTPVAATLPQPVQYAAPEPEPVRYIEPRPRTAAAPAIAELPAAPQVPTIAAAVQAPEASAQVPTVAQAEPAADLAGQSEPAVTYALLQPAIQSAAAPVAPHPTRFEDKPDVAEYVAAAKPRKAAPASGRSNSVVQLGAYGSPNRVAAAWDQIARRYGSLGRYTPVSARFSSPKGIVYRLSVKGFASAGEAQRLCGALQQKGKNCFVRRTAGDAPVRLASR